MWDYDFMRFHLQHIYIAVLILFVMAAMLGLGVGIGWRTEYGQCLAVSGGFQKIFAGTCAASLP